MADQKAIQDIARGCCLTNIAANAIFPDWLGHLGVLLRYTEEAERNNLTLTQQFVPQLLEMVIRPSDAESMLRQRLRSNQPLQWQDLELVERFCFRGPDKT